jgi:peptide/nickel transport system substrate-binding protein
MVGRGTGTVGAVVIVLLLAGAACGGSSSKSGQETTAAEFAPAGGAVSIRLGSDWDTIDPAKTTNTFGYQLVLSLYDRLVYATPDGEVKPYLATKWTITPDSGTFTLRKDAKCSDGTPITPTVVANSLTRLGAKETQAPYGYRTLGRAGYTITPDDAAGTVTIKLNEPNSDMLLALAMPWSSIVCPAGLSDTKALADKAFGSGPFTLEKSSRGSEYVLKARPEWNWGPNGTTTKTAGFPGTITYKVVANDTTAANLVLQGGLDIANVGGQDQPRVAADKSLYRVDSAGIGADGLLMNEAAGRPGADPKVRQAVYMAIDAEKYMQASLAGQGKAMTTLYTDNMGCDDPNGNLVLGYDQEGAKALLAQAGWKPGAGGKLEKDGKKLTIRVLGADVQGSGPEYMLSELQKIGIDAKAQFGDFNSLIDALFKTRDWDLVDYPFGSVMPSPSIFVGQIAGPPPPDGGNVAAVQNSAYDALAKEAAAATPDERCDKWLAAEAELFKATDTKPTQVAVTSYFGKNVRFVALGGADVDPLSIRLTG